MTRAFQWFVMIATLGNVGCGADVLGIERYQHTPGPSYEEAAEVGPFVSSGIASNAPFDAAPGVGWEVAIDISQGTVIEEVSLDAIPFGERPPGLSLVRDSDGLRQAITGAEGDEQGVHFDVHIAADDAAYFLVFTSGDGAAVKRPPVVTTHCD